MTQNSQQFKTGTTLPGLPMVAAANALHTPVRIQGGVCPFVNDIPHQHLASLAELYMSMHCMAWLKIGSCLFAAVLFVTTVEELKDLVEVVEGMKPKHLDCQGVKGLIENWTRKGFWCFWKMNTCFCMVLFFGPCIMPVFYGAQTQNSPPNWHLWAWGSSRGPCTDTPHPTPANDICIISLVFFEVVPGQGQSFLEKTTNDFMVFGQDQFFGKKTHMICGL